MWKSAGERRKIQGKPGDILKETGTPKDDDDDDVFRE